jgi:hypothetical protein
VSTSCTVRLDVELSGQSQGWTDITDDVSMQDAVSGRRGISGNSIADRVATTGTLNFTLLNGPTGSKPARPLGYYSPGHDNLRTGFRKGIGVRARLVIGPRGIVVDSSNNKLDFTEETTGAAVATVASATYTTGELAVAAVQTAMNTAATDNTYAVHYSNIYREISIYRSAGTDTFTLDWSSGPNSGNSIGLDLGYDVSADDTYTGPGEDATDLDGTSDYYALGSDLSGNADGKKGTFSGYIRIDGGNGTNRYVLCNTGVRFCVYVSTVNKISVIGYNSTPTKILHLQTVNTFSASTNWIHILMSWDLEAGVSHLYINGVSDKSEVTLTDDTIDYTATNWGFGSAAGGGNKWNGAISEAWFQPNVYFDFSDADERVKFLTLLNQPEDLGSDGSIPTGTQPILYVPDGDATTNAGSGGNFTSYGSPTADSGPGNLLAADNPSPINEYVHFIGKIASIKPTPGIWYERVSRIMAVDYMDQLSRKRLNTLAPATNVTDDEVFQDIIDAMPHKPRSLEVQTGYDTIDFAFDNLQDERAVPTSEMQRLTSSSLGLVFVRGDGTLIYEVRRQRNFLNLYPLITITESDLPYGDTLDVEDSQEKTINRSVVVIHPRRKDTSTKVLFRLQQPMRIEPGIDTTIRGLYTDPDQRSKRIGGTEMTTPVASTDYILNSKEDGTGTDVTNKATVNATFTANSVVYTINHDHDQAAYLTTLQVRGKGIYDHERTSLEYEDADSIADVGEYATSLDMPYQSDSAFGLELAIWVIALSSQGFKTSSAIKIMLNRLSQERAELFAAREISDRIRLTETQTATSAEFFINQIEWSIESDMGMWISFLPVVADQTQFWYLEVPGKSELGQTTRLGFGLVVGHTDVSHGDIHADESHSDTAHDDQHGDVAHEDGAHGDSEHTDTHSDTPHSDTAHTDYYDDVDHQDVSHRDSHSDVSHADSYTDFAHVDEYTDIPHLDYHEDIEEDFHIDVHEDQEHGDTHTDGAHIDIHTDTPHSDSHNDREHEDVSHEDSHGDVTHVDINHSDTHGDGEHDDAAHADVTHVDTHTDVEHIDLEHEDLHIDTPHGDGQ